MQTPIKTSQTSFSLTEGNQSVQAPAVQWGTDKAAPGGVTQPIKGEIKKIDALITSQQRSTPESGD